MRTGISRPIAYVPIPNEETTDWNPTAIQQRHRPEPNPNQRLRTPHRLSVLSLTIAGVTGHFQETFTQHDQDLTNDNPGEDGTGTGYNNWLYTWY